MDNPSKPFVSVIVPVYQDVERLQKCLTALEAQTYPKELYEVMVVDNGGNPGIETLPGRFPHMVLTTETKPGSYAARNKGIALAKGDILAFTDSDCVPAHVWIESGIQEFTRHGNCGAVGGKIEVTFQHPGKPYWLEFNDYLFGYRQHLFVREGHCACTSNAFTSKKVMERVGLFQAELFSGGDIEWGGRVVNAGLPLIYADSVVVFHAARNTWKALVARSRRISGGVYQRNDNKTLWALIKNLAHLLCPPVRSFYFEVRRETAASRLDQYLWPLFFLRLGLHYIALWEQLLLRCGAELKRA